jgi:hypothetical protein
MFRANLKTDLFHQHDLLRFIVAAAIVNLPTHLKSISILRQPPLNAIAFYLPVVSLDYKVVTHRLQTDYKVATLRLRTTTPDYKTHIARERTTISHSMRFPLLRDGFIY